MKRARVLYPPGLCLLFFCLSLSCPGQQESEGDTLSRRATEAFYLSFDNADSALIIARQVREDAEAAGNKFVVASANNSIGWAFRQKGNYDSARHYLHEAREGFQKENNALNVARVSMNLAEVYTSLNQFATGIQFLLETDSIAKEINEIPISIDVKRQLGII